MGDGATGVLRAELFGISDHLTDQLFIHILQARRWHLSSLGVYRVQYSWSFVFAPPQTVGNPTLYSAYFCRPLL